MVTREDLALGGEFEDREVKLILDALNLAPGPNACSELMAVCADKQFAGLPLAPILHALAMKESTFRPQVVAKEKDGSLAYGLFQFHQPTALPVLKGLGKTWDEFLGSVAVQVDAVVVLMEGDRRRAKGDIKGAFRQFGSKTKKVMYPLVDYLQKQGGGV